MSRAATPYPVPALLVVAAEDLFSNEAEWLQKIDQVARHATRYPSGSIAVQLRPRLSRPRLDKGAGAQLASRLQELLDAADPGGHLPIYASARHPWLRTAAAWRLHVPEVQLSSAQTEDVPAWSASVHSAAAAQRATKEGAHMLLVAPVFAPDWKPAKAMGLESLREIAAACTTPVLALGGIQPERVADCLEAGAAGVAAASGIMLAPNAAAVMRAFAEALGLSAKV